MAEPKTRPTGADAQALIAARATPAQQADCEALIALLSRLTGEPPVVWGPSIVGFSRYRATGANGKSTDWMATGMAVRGRELVLYLVAEGPQQESLRARLGPHTMGKSCLYFKHLADLDATVLEQLVVDSLAELRRRHGPAPA